MVGSGTQYFILFDVNKYKILRILSFKLKNTTFNEIFKYIQNQIGIVYLFCNSMVRRVITKN